MIGKLKEKITKVSKETVKTELKSHLSEILSGASVALLLYLCIRSNEKHVTVNVVINGRHIC